MQDKSNEVLLGSRLVEEGVINPSQLEEALTLNAAGDETPLGTILTKLGYCSEDDITRVMAGVLGVEFISLETYPVDKAAVTAVPVEVIKRYRVAPVGVRDGKLVLAMENPSDITVLDDLRCLTGFDIVPVMAPGSELDAAVDRHSRGRLPFEVGTVEETPAEYVTVVDDKASKGPAVRLANMIITQAVDAGASDIHVEPYEHHLRIRFRIDGVLHDWLEPPRRIHASLVSRFKIMADMDIAERRVPQDGRITLKVEDGVIDIRVASLPTTYGERLTLRLLDRSRKVISLEELGVAPSILERLRGVISLPHGFILVTGPTGSGKTTTLYAVLANIDNVGKNVITIEDPVEYRLEGMNQIQINPRAGLTFASGLRSVLRSDPDVIMVGEIRDKETARISVESALTGHLVFSTLHTNDAAGAVSRLTDMGIEPFLTASSLVCVLAQRLVRVLCLNCREPYEMSRNELERIPGFPLEDGENMVTLYRPGRCLRCSNTGYRGRIGIFELLPVSEAIQKMTIKRNSSREITQAALAEGMVTLYQDGMSKVKQGVTSLEELMRVIV